MQSFTIITKNTAKIMIKKSSFIACTIPIFTTEEAKKEIKHYKETHKASHHPYAYHLTSIKNNKIVTEEKYSDDGEPSKTAGLPILQTIKKESLTNCLIIIARVFGGIKLGPAGLIKAFSKSAKETIKEKIVYEPTTQTSIEISLSKLQHTENILEKEKIKYKKTFTGTTVTLNIQLPIKKKKVLEKMKY